jgi:hypothetical protein
MRDLDDPYRGGFGFNGGFGTPCRHSKINRVSGVSRARMVV